VWNGLSMGCLLGWLLLGPLLQSPPMKCFIPFAPKHSPPKQSGEKKQLMVNGVLIIITQFDWLFSSLIDLVSMSPCPMSQLTQSIIILLLSTLSPLITLSPLTSPYTLHTPPYYYYYYYIPLNDGFCEALHHCKERYSKTFHLCRNVRNVTHADKHHVEV
jgi:hypothetical protein